MVLDKFLCDVLDMYLFGVPLALILGGCLRYLYSHRKRTEQLENQIQELQEQVIVVTGNSVPGRKITRVIGPVVGFSSMSSYNTGKFQQAEREAMLCLIKKAREEGASAVIDLKMETGSSEKSEGVGTNPKVTYLGTAVIM